METHGVIIVFWSYAHSFLAKSMLVLDTRFSFATKCLEHDNIVFDKDENEMDIPDFDIYENERQGKRYPYPFFLEEDKWNSTDDDFSMSCPTPIHITHKPEGAHTRTSTTQASSAEDLGTPISVEPIICDSSSGDGDDVVAIQIPTISTLKESATASVAHTHSRERRRLERHSTHAPSTPEIIKQFLPFEKFKAAYTSSDTNQIEFEEDRSAISSISASTTCATAKESRTAEVFSDADPSIGEIEFLNIDQFVNTDTSNSTSNTSIIEAEKSDIVEEDSSAEEENRTESASSYCGESNSETRFSEEIAGHASPVHPVASTSQLISSQVGGNNVTRKRGRPAKDHADGPNPKLMLRMNKEQRKAYEDRLKNNEASRISRRKKKKSEEEEKKGDSSAEEENRTESASSYCGESNSETRFSEEIAGHASPVHPVASTSQLISSQVGGNNVTRKRGRPAKDHADGPNPKLMLRMNKAQRKAYEDRIKNNEASRISRRKKKKSEEEEKKIEADLAAENLRLRELADKVACQERKLKKFLVEHSKVSFSLDTLRRAPV
ncbi:eukaryotic translation initiation factor 5B-like isoform X2 [Drosophila subpulchrella]|uniref:eukaryotic translation initiation factor 5B-like isoform X2 n=1 Tax=Drosophila subpulchrella TaxID=1486046 RepID=UPI0018A1B205|nr:eukaryotic translation initiation factor 5B-like isoform X2 [Drosophila subpulchrella]